MLNGQLWLRRQHVCPTHHSVPSGDMTAAAVTVTCSCMFDSVIAFVWLPSSGSEAVSVCVWCMHVWCMRVCARLQVNTKVDMRFDIDKAGWIPDEVKEAMRRAVSAQTAARDQHSSTHDTVHSNPIPYRELFDTLSAEGSTARHGAAQHSTHTRPCYSMLYP